MIATSCNPIILEFAKGLLGSSVNASPHVAKFRLNQKFSPVDTMIQYVDHFILFRKQSQAAEVQQQFVLGQSQMNINGVAPGGMPFR